MTPPKLLLPVLMILTQAVAFADGGAVQFRQEAGGFAITVFTSPAPLSAGAVDISLLLQNRNGLEPVLDASVSLLLRAQDFGRGNSRAARPGSRRETSCYMQRP
jgi:predicted anti-sigma-YlaC factor YlaD